MEEGKWCNVDRKGRITSEYFYLNGDLEGAHLWYDTLGKVYQKTLYKAGEKIHHEVIDSLYRQGGVYDKDGFTKVEVMPILKSCSALEGEEREKCRDREFLKYIYGNIRYPEIARENDIEGRAIIRFIINKKGQVEKMVALRGICKEIEKECMRVISNSPEWSPGLVKGEPVNVYFNMPVVFRLE